LEVEGEKVQEKVREEKYDYDQKKNLERDENPFSSSPIPFTSTFAFPQFTSVSLLQHWSIEDSVSLCSYSKGKEKKLPSTS
jgi:hypothetical protein